MPFLCVYVQAAATEAEFSCRRRARDRARADEQYAEQVARLLLEQEKRHERENAALTKRIKELTQKHSAESALGRTVDEAASTPRGAEGCSNITDYCW